MTSENVTAIRPAEPINHRGCLEALGELAARLDAERYRVFEAQAVTAADDLYVMLTLEAILIDVACLVEELDLKEVAHG